MTTKNSYPQFGETKEALKKAGIPYEMVKRPAGKTLEEILLVLGIGPDQGVSSMLFETERGIGEAFRRDDHQLDMEKMKRVLGVKKIRFLSREEVKEKSGSERLYISPYNPGLSVIMDETIFEKSLLHTGSGHPDYDLKITPDNLLQFLHAKSADIILSGAVRAKARILSGITPSGDGTLHIGNYLGAVKQFIDLSKSHECFLMVADLHALTTVQEKKHLQQNVETLIINELALLGDAEFSFFRQSDVPMHTELQSILNNVTPLGLIKRAHAYKDKLAKDVMEDEINLGLFNYPVLMAADILLYKADLVPVGKDQKQHIEIARDIAQCFNRTYKKDVLVLPDPYIPEDVAAVLGTDGKRKMSKTLGNVVSIFESEETIRKQVMGAYTDPTRIHATDPGHTEGNMVFHYLDFFGEKKTVQELKDRYTKGKVTDVEVKDYLYEILMKTFAPARIRYLELKENPKKIQDILEQGASTVGMVASQTMKEVRETIGLTNKYSFFEYEQYAKPPFAKSTLKSVALDNQISIDEFAKVEVRVGKVLEAKNKEGSEKLIRLVVDLSEENPRIIFTGVRGFGYTPEDFLNKQFFFIANLAPRKMMDEESQGMILAVDGEELPFGKHGEKKPLFISAEGMPLGAKIR